MEDIDITVLYQQFVEDPDFLAFPGFSREESAWEEAFQRYRQWKNNQMALSLVVQEDSNMKKQRGIPRKYDPAWEYDPGTKHWRKKRFSGTMKPMRHIGKEDSFQTSAFDLFQEYMKQLKRER